MIPFVTYSFYRHMIPCHVTSIQILTRTMKSLNCGVVGFIGEFNNLEFKKNDAEVEKIFTVPIEVLIDQSVFRKTYFRNSSDLRFV